jgi:hypothetical protein
MIQSVLEKMKTNKKLAAILLPALLVAASSLFSADLALGVTQSQSQQENQNRVNNPETGEMTQEQEREQLEKKVQEAKPEYSPQNGASQSRYQRVNQALESMARLSHRLGNQNLGEQIQNIVRNQANAEDVINQGIDNAQRRSALTRFFLGPNYQELADVKREMERNQLRIQELNKIKAQIKNESDQQELTLHITTLEQQNTALQNNLKELTSGFSLFGWFFRLLYWS